MSRYQRRLLDTLIAVVLVLALPVIVALYFTLRKR